jgi:undecaprenyl-diphosphatase
LVDTIVKIAVDRDRPSLTEPIATAHGQSFPSGHSMTSVVAYGALVLIFLPVVRAALRRYLIAGAVVLCLAIGFSRLALGVHYITDVLGGFALGAAWLTASVAAFSVWRVERGRQPVHPTAGLEPEAKKDLRKTG